MREGHDQVVERRPYPAHPRCPGMSRSGAKDTGAVHGASAGGAGQDDELRQGIEGIRGAGSRGAKVPGRVCKWLE
jgi:hypothetical protein